MDKPGLAAAGAPAEEPALPVAEPAGAEEAAPTRPPHEPQKVVPSATVAPHFPQKAIVNLLSKLKIRAHTGRTIARPGLAGRVFLIACGEAALAGATGEARKSYEEFLRYWKGADADLPLLKEAKLQFAKLGLPSPQ